MVAHFCHSWAHFSLLSWLPSYYHDTDEDALSAHSSNSGSAGAASHQHSHHVLVVPYAIMGICNVLAARKADALLEAGVGRTKVG